VPPPLPEANSRHGGLERGCGAQGGKLARAVAALPESQCRRGTCNTCSCQGQRAKGRSSAQQAALTRPPPPVAACATPELCSNVSPSQVLEPTQPVAPPPTFPTPQAIAYQDACPELARRPPAHITDYPVQAAPNPPGIPIEHPTVMPSPPPPRPIPRLLRPASRFWRHCWLGNSQGQRTRRTSGGLQAPSCSMARQTC